MKKGIKILGAIEELGTIEGGDIAWIDYHTLAVANAYRTNQSGIDQLRSFLKPLISKSWKCTYLITKVPEMYFILCSIFSPIDRGYSGSLFFVDAGDFSQCIVGPPLSTHRSARY